MLLQQLLMCMVMGQVPFKAAMLLFFLTGIIWLIFQSSRLVPAHNACDDSPCEDGAMCIPELGTESYSCHCLPGYTGHSCGIDIDDCEDVFCPENSTCEDGINSFTCVCNDGYQALNCTARSNEGMTKSTNIVPLGARIHQGSTLGATSK